MPKMIQLRHVPDKLHRKLKARAARERLSLSDYLIREIERLAGAPTNEEFLERLAGRTPVETPTDSAQLVRDLRDSR